MIAFTDSNDGYYQVDAPDGFVPEWAKDMIPCEVVQMVEPDSSEAVQSEINRLERVIVELKGKLK